jgi:hypothetical protein
MNHVTDTAEGAKAKDEDVRKIKALGARIEVSEIGTCIG